ncbi:MAG TPA: DoxX family protein [Candidatus Angelobacter sp.]|nr:DoxX family protein [Candidatus Angelobacter sp.]
MADTRISSRSMALARIAVGIMFLFFAQFKLMHPNFAHGGYQSSVTEYVTKSAVSFWKPTLRLTLSHPVISGYAVGAAELLIGLSMVLGFLVRPFSVLGILFMLNLVLCTWWLPPGTPLWRYAGNQLEHIPLLLLFWLFAVHNAGATLGLDRAR